MRRYSDLFTAGWTAFNERDTAILLAVNHWSDIAWIRTPLRIVSRLGDGVIWYVLMTALLAAGGAEGVRPVTQMVAAGAVGVAVYTILKRRTLRPRPYQVHADIRLCGVPLDHYSFPSGHTLHAVAMTLITTAHVPALAPLLLPFMLLVALSRVVLGLHYPSDVLAGALLGALIGSAALCAL